MSVSGIYIIDLTFNRHMDGIKRQNTVNNLNTIEQHERGNRDEKSLNIIICQHPPRRMRT